MTTSLMRIPQNKLSAVAAALASGDRDVTLRLAEPTGVHFPADVLAGLVEDALATLYEKSDIGKSELDAFLAPRLHYCLRLPRSLAADPGVWAWLAVRPMWPYMDHRWQWEPGDNPWRYNSPDVLRNGVSRLWWGAEMVRSGPDYGLVPSAFTSVRAFQNISELRYSWHRECARAFTRVLAKHHYSGDELSPLFNAYLRTQCLELFDRKFVERERVNWDVTWASKVPKPAEVKAPVGSLVGPNAGYARADVEERLFEWLDDLYQSIARAPVQRKRREQPARA